MEGDALASEQSVLLKICLKGDVTERIPDVSDKEGNRAGKG